MEATARNHLMRDRLRSVVCTCLFILGFISVSWGREDRADLFVGVWEMVEMSNGSDEGSMVKVPPGNYKIFGADGSYHFMRFHPQGSVYVQEGKFDVLSDSTYVERIDWALMKQVEGKAHTLTYRLNNDGTLSIEGKGEIVFRETWRKVANYGVMPTVD